MLRKTAHIILALLLLVATTGVTFSMHYCGGRLISTSINHEVKHCCNDMDRCCNNRTIHYEVKDDFIGSSAFSKVVPLEFDIIVSVLFVTDFVLFEKEQLAYETCNDSSPPPLIQTRLALFQTYLC